MPKTSAISLNVICPASFIVIICRSVSGSFSTVSLKFIRPTTSFSIESAIPAAVSAADASGTSSVSCSRPAFLIKSMAIFLAITVIHVLWPLPALYWSAIFHSLIKNSAVRSSAFSLFFTTPLITAYIYEIYASYISFRPVLSPFCIRRIHRSNSRLFTRPPHLHLIQLKHIPFFCNHPIC